MSISEIIVELINLPRRFNDLRNISIYSLLKETGYFEMHSQISESAIREALLRHPQCVNEWMLLSEGKRSSAGWYFRRSGKESYEVGYFSSKRSDIQPVEYADEAAACAAFIKREIEDIRTGGKQLS